MIFIAILVFFLFLTNIALAFRCGNDLVFIGDNVFDVLEKCGEPSLKINKGRIIKRGRTGIISYNMEEWYYKPCGGFTRILIFHGGTLVEMKSGKRN